MLNAVKEMNWSNLGNSWKDVNSILRETIVAASQSQKSNAAIFKQLAFYSTVGIIIKLEDI